MLVTENFLQTVIQGYQESPKIAGQLLIYNYKNQKFEKVLQKRAQIGLKIRFIVFYFLTLATVVRIMDSNLQMKGNERKGNPIVETNMCIMVLFVFVLFAERYRSRSESPGDFIDFLNGAILLEQKCERGKYLKNIFEHILLRSAYL